MLELLKELCTLSGAAGNEDDVRNYIIKRIDGKCDWRVDKRGNIIAFKEGKMRPSSKIMIDAHMDEVGIIATYVTDDGLVKFATVGGINTECLMSQRFRFENGTVGVVGCVPIHLTQGDERKKLPKKENLYVDIGCDDKQSAEKLVRPGDFAVFDRPFVSDGETVFAKAIDDRAGCAAIIKMIEGQPLYDFYATFTVQEEVGHGGAVSAAYAIDPDFCICLESTTASDIAGVGKEDRVCVAGDGPVISFMDRATLYDRELFKIAMSCGVKCQAKTAVAGGNNSGAIHRSRDGVRTVAVSVPCRYIHSASCAAKLSDINGVYDMAVALLSKIGAGL